MLAIPKCGRCGDEHWKDIHSGRWHHDCSQGAPRAVKPPVVSGYDARPALLLTSREFKELLEYSTSLPTGTTIGKRWKREILCGPDRGKWIIGEYVEHPEPKTVGIKWYRPVIRGAK